MRVCTLFNILASVRLLTTFALLHAVRFVLFFVIASSSQLPVNVVMVDDLNGVVSVVRGVQYAELDQRVQ